MERVEIVVYSKDTPRTKEFETILDELGRKSAIVSVQYQIHLSLRNSHKK
jgi:hypothetical protein